jgi:hypothetical protein
MFTIGKTVRYSGSDDGGNSYIKYRYYVDSLKYFGLVKDDYKNGAPINKYFKVEYSKIKPEISRMYLNSEILDSTKITKVGFKYYVNK